MVSSKLTRLVACIGLVAVMGCAGSNYGHVTDTCNPQVCTAFVGDGPRPVADVSGDELFLPHFFTGIGIAQVWPRDSSLVNSTVFDVNMTFDLGSRLAFEIDVGYWEIADRPANWQGNDSSLLMNPFVAFLQIYDDIPKWRSRYYFGAGMGYSINSYHLGSRDEYYVEAIEGVVDYSHSVTDGTLMKVAVGWEFYSTATADLNLALELSYIDAQGDRVIERTWASPAVTEEYIPGEFPMDEIWMFRANFTWHF